MKDRGGRGVRRDGIWEKTSDRNYRGKIQVTFFVISFLVRDQANQSCPAVKKDASLLPCECEPSQKIKAKNEVASFQPFPRNKGTNLDWYIHFIFF